MVRKEKIAHCQMNAISEDGHSKGFPLLNVSMSHLAIHLDLEYYARELYRRPFEQSYL